MSVYVRRAGAGNKIVGFPARGGLNLMQMIHKAMETPMSLPPSGWGAAVPIRLGVVEHWETLIFAKEMGVSL